MYKCLAVVAVFACVASGCAVERRLEDRREARDVCLERARETGHQVRRVLEEHAENPEIYRVTLDVENDNQNLICDYHEDSRVAELHW